MVNLKDFSITLVQAYMGSRYVAQYLQIHLPYNTAYSKNVDIAGDLLNRGGTQMVHVDKILKLHGQPLLTLLSKIKQSIAKLGRKKLVIPSEERFKIVFKQIDFKILASV